MFPVNTFRSRTSLGFAHEIDRKRPGPTTQPDSIQKRFRFSLSCLFQLKANAVAQVFGLVKIKTPDQGKGTRHAQQIILQYPRLSRCRGRVPRCNTRQAVRALIAFQQKLKSHLGLIETAGRLPIQVYVLDPPGPDQLLVQRIALRSTAVTTARKKNRSPDPYERNEPNPSRAR